MKKVRAKPVLTLQQHGDFAPGILLSSAALGQERSTEPLSLGRVSSLCGSALKAAFSNGKEHKVGTLCGTIQCTLAGHTRTPGYAAWGEQVDISTYFYDH